MSPSPQRNRPQYSGSAGAVPDFIDTSTQEYSRGQDPVTGAITTEAAEVRASLSTVTKANGSAATNLAQAGGDALALTGDNLGGSTGATVGGVAVTSFVVVDETHATCVSPAKAAGTFAVVVQNPDGNSTETKNVTYV